MFQGKMKAITFSYDDAVTQDIRLIEIFNKYGLKGTFNLNSERLGQSGELLREGVTVSFNKVRPEDVKSVYAGHEVAAHTLTHPTLTKLDDDAEIIRQVEQDRQNLSQLVGYEVLGFAYPGGGVNHSEHIAQLIRENTGIKYCRTTVPTFNFEPQKDLYLFKPTVHHHGDWDRMIELAEDFLAMKTDRPQIFYIWGHSFEFDIHDDWAKFEEFCKHISGRSDVFYGTNKEVLL